MVIEPLSPARGTEKTPPEESPASLPTNVWLVGQESPPAQRRGRYSPASIREHPGKMLPEVARRLVETYTRPGDRILDPLSGIGTIGVEAIRRGRPYVGLELEPRFIALQLENLERARRDARTKAGPKDAPMGEFLLCRGDARGLDPDFPGGPSGLLGQLGPFDAVLTSPPYGGRGENPRKASPPGFRRLVAEGKLGATAVPDCSALSRENLGHLKEDAEHFAGMRHVYAGCYRLLRPGGVMGLALRFGRQRERLRPLPHETARLCVSLGFVFLDEVAAVLGRIAVDPDGSARVIGHPSFGHRRAIERLRGQGLPVSLNQVEQLLVFRKPERSSSLPP